MNRRMLARLAAGIASAAAAGAIVFTNVAGAGPTPPSPLTASDLSRYWISSASDTTGLAANAPPVESVTKQQAIAAAQAEIGSTDTNVRVLLERAALYPGQAERDVWIVLFVGGTSPMDGPFGAAPVTYQETGILIDAATGEFLRGFMQ